MADTPHDALFKAVFAQPEHAAGALRAVLPAALSAAVDWASLTRCPGSFVDDELRQRHTDLLFSARLHGGAEALVYLLFEHQSSVEPLMAYRLLHYLVRVWEQWLRDHQGATALPALVPVVLYHGSAAWSAPRSLSELLDLPAELAGDIAAHTPQLSYLVDDLSAVSDEQLRGRAMTALATLATACFKHVRTSPDFVVTLSAWADLARKVLQAPRGLEALAHIVRYSIVVSNLDHERFHAMLEREVGPDAKEVAVTLGQKLIEQGREEGRRTQTQALLLRLLVLRFGEDVKATIEPRLHDASISDLERWVDRILTARSMDEIFAD